MLLRWTRACEAGLSLRMTSNAPPAPRARTCGEGVVVWWTSTRVSMACCCCIRASYPSHEAAGTCALRCQRTAVPSEAQPEANGCFLRTESSGSGRASVMIFLWHASPQCVAFDGDHCDQVPVAAMLAAWHLVRTLHLLRSLASPSWSRWDVEIACSYSQLFRGPQ